MPKERFHLYLADEIVNRCAGSLPSNEIHSLPTHLRTPAFSIGAISPDIFYYDLPSFSLSSLGNALHDLMDREGISIISGWIAQTSSPLKTAHASTVLWGLGFACHFLTDALWHPVINELSGSRLVRDYIGVKRLSKIEGHRLLESELEALWLARSRTPERYDELLKDFKRDRGRLLEIASYYRRFLEFAGLSAGVSERRIVKCCLSQNFLLRLFASRMLGG
ncbi:MAG TPA: zinc dependent phospholipase C family protein, partial [Deltaproteobacteria bacterium]|nr:zinc dependent phospholipase C family protein [Deltaproteobacteria bacterium]